jgi:hypothetical protein
MCTSTFVPESLPPAILAYLETPYEADHAPGLPPECFRTTYSRQLARHDLQDKATRADNETSYFHWYRDADLATWRQHAANSMLRTMPYHAKKLAEQQYVKHLPLADFLGDTLSRVTFTLPTWDVESSQHLLKVLFALTNRLLPKSLSKIASARELPAIKILHTRPMTLDLARKIQSALPPGVKFQYSNHPATAVRQELRATTAADLPSSDTHRADLEAILGNSHQVRLHKFSKAERQKFVYGGDGTYTNFQEGDPPPESPSKGKRKGKVVPKNPATGKPAIWRSKMVDENVRGDGIPEQDWVLIGSD